MPLYSIGILPAQAQVKGNDFAVPSNSRPRVAKSDIAKLLDYSGIEGKKMGDFEARDLSGRIWTNADFSGRVTFVAFWFNGCAPCRAEIPKILDLARRFRDEERFQVLSITFDDTILSKQTVAETGINYPVARLSNEDCHRLMNGKGFATNYIIDAEGNIAAAGAGMSIGFEDEFLKRYPQVIEELLTTLRKGH